MDPKHPEGRHRGESPGGACYHGGDKVQRADDACGAVVVLQGDLVDGDGGTCRTDGKRENSQNTTTQN